MTGKIALCVEEAACRAPEIIGLGGEALDAQGWLDVYTDGLSARAAFADDKRADEAWVVSCVDVEPINLAATIKSDSPGTHVCLVNYEEGGSLPSRALAAAIDEVVSPPAFVRRYGEAKAARSGASLGEAPAEGLLEPGSPEGALRPGGPGPEEGGGASAEGAHGRKKESAPDKGRSRSKLKLAFGISSSDAESADDAGESGPSHVLATNAAVELLEMPATARDSGAAGRPLAVAAPEPVVRVAGSPCFVMPVVSGSGGAGKSTVSVTSAFISRDRGNRTLLLDYDLQFGDAAVLAGARGALALDEALERPDRLEAELAKGQQLVVLAAPPRLEMADAVVAGMPGLLERLAQAFDVVVANTGAAWAEQHALLLERSSAALFLIDQRASSVRACKHALGLCARCGIASSPFQFAVNRCAKGAPLSAMDVSTALGGVFVHEIRDGGRDVEDYLGAGGAEDLMRAGNEFCSSLAQVMDALLPASACVEAPASDAEDRKALRRRARHANRKRGWRK